MKKKENNDNKPIINLNQLTIKTMCGLIGMFNFVISNKKTKTKPKPVNEEVINQLQDQLSRGKEGFGVLMINKKNEIEVSRATEITKTLLDLYMKESPMIILHHRNPTSSENKISQTHPIIISDGSLKYDYYVVHNGVIENTEELKEKHEKLGFIYKTIRRNYYNKEEYNDSESLAIEIARYIEKQTKEILIEGSAAFIVVQTDKKTKKAINIFFGRKDNPIKLTGRQGEIRLSSEGKGENITEKTLYKFNVKSPSLTKTTMKFKEKESRYYWENETYDEQIKLNNKIKYNTEKEQEITEEDILENELETISNDFTLSSTEIIEKFAEKLGEISEINQMDIESEKKALAIDIITNAQKAYNLALDTTQDLLYENIEKEIKEKIKKDDEKEEKKMEITNCYKDYGY